MEESATLSLGDRMKSYEKFINDYPKIPPYKPFAVRLDGHTFSKFTKGFTKPFDNNFQSAMIMTMNDLMTKFLPVTGYTHSDEITLIFRQACTKEEFDSKTNKSTHLFDGKVQKLNSLLAGYCSARFNYHITKIINRGYGYPQEFIDKVNSCEAHFDCRIILFPDDKEHEVVNLLFWRSVMDCHRNAVSTYARYFCRNKKIEGMHSDKMIELMKKEKNFDWNNNVPLYYKHGVYAKKELYETNVSVPNGEVIKVTRQRTVNMCFKIQFSEKVLEFIMSKSCPDNMNDNYGLEIKKLIVEDGGIITI